MVWIGTWKIVLIFTISKEKMIRAINIRNKIFNIVLTHRSDQRERNDTFQTPRGPRKVLGSWDMLGLQEKEDNRHYIFSTYIHKSNIPLFSASSRLVTNIFPAGR